MERAATGAGHRPEVIGRFIGHAIRHVATHRACCQTKWDKVEARRRTRRFSRLNDDLDATLSHMDGGVPVGPGEARG